MMIESEHESRTWSENREVGAKRGKTCKPKQKYAIWKLGRLCNLVDYKSVSWTWSNKESPEF